MKDFHLSLPGRSASLVSGETTIHICCVHFSFFSAHMQHRPWDVDEEDAQPEKMSRKKRRAAEAAARGADVASGEAYKQRRRRGAAGPRHQHQEIVLRQQVDAMRGELAQQKMVCPRPLRAPPRTPVL